MGRRRTLTSFNAERGGFVSIYAIGDIHGAIDLLDSLLKALDRRGPVDELWFVGDLVNRGPDSAAVIRRVRGLGERAVTVLGNHDLALLELVRHEAPETTAPPSLLPLLQAHDREILLDWLRHRPLMHRDTRLGWTMVHAGLPPDWDIACAETQARRLETALRGPEHGHFLDHLFGNTPSRWSKAKGQWRTFRFIANALTRVRFVDRDGNLDMKYKKTRADAPAHLLPWFQHPTRASRDQRIVFGHWSALDRVAWPDDNVWGIDTGAAWGGALSALALDDPAATLIQIDAKTHRISERQTALETSG